MRETHLICRQGRRRSASLAAHFVTLAAEFKLFFCWPAKVRKQCAPYSGTRCAAFEIGYNLSKATVKAGYKVLEAVFTMGKLNRKGKEI